MARVIACLLLLGCIAQVAQGYPTFITREGPRACDGHPEKAYGMHKAPQKDSATKFTVVDAANNKAALAMCPGATYKVTLTFPDPRMALLTANAGAFSKGGADCPNRQFFDRTSGFGPKATQEISLLVPCGQTQAITLKSTSARGPASPYFQASLTLPVAATGCMPTAACKSAAGTTAAVRPAAAPAVARP